MPNKIQRVRLTGTIIADGSATAYSQPLAGKILAVQVNYPAATCTVDIDTDGEGGAAQKIIDLAAANTDATYYPRTPVCTYAGAQTIYWEGTNKVCEPFVVNGRLKLTVASGTDTQIVSVDIIYEEY